MRLTTAGQMRRLDAAAIDDYGIPAIVLMENAGRSVVDALAQRFGDPVGRRVVIFVGPGNNGGDGLVIARYLHQRGSQPQVVLLAESETFTGAAAVNLAIVRKLAIPIHPATDGRLLLEQKTGLHGCAMIVDALFGTGLRREIGGHYAACVKLINSAAKPVVAVDIPSGVHSDTGQILGCAVQADLTVTFGFAKPGMVVYPGVALTGRLVVADIGIPPEVSTGMNFQYELLDAATVGNWLPVRNAEAHKGTFGHLGILAGSAGKTGAAILAATGALRVGTGLVSLWAPSGLNTVFETELIEAMTMPLTQSAGFFLADDYRVIDQSLAGKQAVVLGPGIGQQESTARLVEEMYRRIPLPMVVDADGLNILADNPEGLAAPGGLRVLTPHPGEMARLCRLAKSDIQADRLNRAREVAEKYQVVVVLKGARTIIASPQGKVAVNPTGNPGMAAGGMGDVLAGMIGGFLAQGAGGWEAACLGVFGHGLAADRLADEKGAAGYLASEVAVGIPAVLEALRGEKHQLPKRRDAGYFTII